jgi:hypothetical protein
VLSPQSTKKPSKNTVETWIQSRDGKQLKVRDALIFDVQQVGGDTDGGASPHTSKCQLHPACWGA